MFDPPEADKCLLAFGELDVQFYNRTTLGEGTMTENRILQPIQIKGMTLKNRIAFAPFYNMPATRDGRVSDLTIRYKWNLWGNDSGDTAFAIMPFVTIPTGTELSTDEAEGGVVAMFGWDVAETWSVGGQVELDFVYDDEDGDHDTEFLHTFVLGFDIVGPLGGYIEYIGIASGDGGIDYQVLGSTGLTWQINENLVFDVGTQIGLTDDADDFNIFTGMTIRF